MKPTIDFISALLLIGTAQGLILALVLRTTEKGNVRANKMLGLFLLLSSYMIFNNFLRRSFYLTYVPHLSIIAGPMIFADIVVLYWYVRLMTEQGFKLGWMQALHMLPFIGAVILLLPFYALSGSEKINYVYQSGIPMERSIREIAQLIQALVYLSICLRLLLKRRRALKEKYSSIDRINLKWLLFLVIGFCMIWIIASVVWLSGRSLSTSSSTPVLFALLICAIGFMGLRQPEIFSKSEKEENTTAKYESSPLSEKDMDAILEKSDRQIASDRLFTDPNITLAKLAKRIAVKPHHLSQAINTRRNRNFFEYINEYRINEAKLRLADPASMDSTLLSLAFEVGFNSKSVFNSAFKKFTGFTPSGFRKKIQSAGKID